MDYANGKILVEGKTKIVREVNADPRLAVLEAKDDITAGDGVKHDVIAGKAELATWTTCNVFRLLKTCGVDLAFQEQLDDIRFRASSCAMLPYEVVVRREAHGSFLKRDPSLRKGHVFPKLVVEFFLKTKDKTWEGHTLPKDDPYLILHDDEARLFRPDVPLHAQEPFLTLRTFPLQDDPAVFGQMSAAAKRTFLILEKAWQLLGRRLVDFKVEFGRDREGKLLLADVIDNDSWRVVENGEYIDKQVYRDGGSIDIVAERYRRVRELTGRFAVPQQQLILWRGSEKDPLEPFETAFAPHAGRDCALSVVTCSMHKSPVSGYGKLTRLVQEVPDSVVIAFIGRSNGAGPTLSANTTVPVITVPAGWKEFPDDVWSSLRMPSNVPVLTVLEPANAVLAALQILAMRNPRLYADLRMRQEERLVNVIIQD